MLSSLTWWNWLVLVFLWICVRFEHVWVTCFSAESGAQLYPCTKNVTKAGHLNKFKNSLHFLKNWCPISEASAAALVLVAAWPVGPTWQPSSKPVWPSFATRNTVPKPAAAPYVCARLYGGLRPEQTRPLRPLREVEGHLRESTWVTVVVALWSLNLIWHWRFRF